MATLASMTASGDDHLAVADDEIGGASWSPPHSMAQPPSTGRSTPVIWRETSLARNRQALATSASIVTRLSAYSAAWRLHRLLDA